MLILGFSVLVPVPRTACVGRPVPLLRSPLRHDLLMHSVVRCSGSILSLGKCGLPHFLYPLALQVAYGHAFSPCVGPYLNV